MNAKLVAGAMAMGLGLSAAAPTRSEALVLGCLSGNAPLAVAGGLMIFPGMGAGAAIGWAAGRLVTWNFSDDDNQASEIGLGIGGIGIGVAGLILDDSGQPKAMNINAEVVAKWGEIHGYTRDEVREVQSDVALIDRYIPTDEPVKVGVGPLRRGSNARSASYQKKLAGLVEKTTAALTERINANGARIDGASFAPVKLHDRTSRFIFALQGAAN